MSPSPRDYLVSVWQLGLGTRTRDERFLAAERRADVAPFLPLDKPLRVLDLANGRLRPQYLLLEAEGHRVVGIDLINRPRAGWKDRGYQFARWLYGLHLATPNGPAADGLVCGDVGRLPFADNSFDLITSIAAFEHFLDVEHVIADLHRVVRPGGVAWIRVHPFTAPSGGHNLRLTEIPLRKLPRGIDAWDHLRQQRLPINVPLNKWRLSQYVDCISKYFEVVEHHCAMREGEHLLSPELEKELSDYSREELTCGAYVIVARKKERTRVNDDKV